MDLFTLKSLLFLLIFIGCCAGQNVLYAALGRSVTLKTFQDILDDDVLVWTFYGGTQGTRVATVSRAELVVHTPYEGKVSVNRANGDLTLNSLEMEDSGYYTFTVTSSGGDAYAAGIELEMLEPISCTKITGPTVTLIAGSSTATLSCQAAAGTMMTRTWLKDGKPLSASSHLVFSDDMSSMTINPLQKEDDGEYTCQLNNIISIDEASYKMVVNSGPEPAMVTGPDTVEVNDHLTLTCSAASTPPRQLHLEV
ncbi:carcinoembryonic antigen-related cell adhesion molecule 1-like [Lates japonicus]